MRAERAERAAKNMVENLALLAALVLAAHLALASDAGAAMPARVVQGAQIFFWARLAPHIGRGGWSWYTGSAGWMYRLVIESLLGLRLSTTTDGARLHLPASEHGPGVVGDSGERREPHPV